jgi:predicted PurR-regulated permease PerM
LLLENAVIASLNIGSATRWGLNLLALLGGAVALYLGESIFIPTVIALLLAAMLWPVVRWMRKALRLPWTISCLTVVVALVALNLLATISLIPLTVRLLQDLPRPNEEKEQKAAYEKIRNRLKDVVPLPEVPTEQDPVFQYLRQTLDGPYITDALIKLGLYANNWLWQWVLIMFILLFLLVEGPMLTRRVVEIFGPSAEAQANALDALGAMAHHVRTYLVWRTIVNIGLALLVGAVYQTMELRQPWTWAFITGVLCYVPYLGPLAAGIPPVIDAFINLSPQWAVAVIIFYTAVITLEGYVIVPVVMGRSMELNATTVMLACLFWERIWGLPGLFMAMPLMAAIKAICYHVPDWRPWANLMSTRVHMAPSEKVTPPPDQTQTLLPEEIDAIEAAHHSRLEKKS